MAADKPDTDSKANAKLVQYLNEAHGKEKELETSLAAHIEMATRPAYKKRLKEHLKETKQHSRLVERRLKKLGGAGITGKATELASRGVAATKGPLHALRGTGEAEKQLKNAKTEFSEEHEEIATYLAIETLAESVGDTETAKLAKQIRREEERMASFLEKQIPLLTRDVAKAEIPASERRAARNGGTRRRSSSRKRSNSTKRSSSTTTTGTRRRSSGTKASKASRTPRKRATARR